MSLPDRDCGGRRFIDDAEKFSARRAARIRRNGRQTDGIR